MSVGLCKKASGKRVTAVLRVAAGECYLGDILLAGARVWRHADTIPGDVVMKALVAHTRQRDLCGQVTSRADGGKYSWFLVGSAPSEALAA
jgi:hypothetical protein